jgi:hypothetical protein
MFKHVLLAAGFVVALASTGSAASLSPAQIKQSATVSDLVEVKKKKGGKSHAKRHHSSRKYHAKRNRNYNWNRHYSRKRHYNRNRHYGRNYHRGGYWYGGRSWSRRYYARPRSWQTWGCINVGPIWYCP